MFNKTIDQLVSSHDTFSQLFKERGSGNIHQNVYLQIIIYCKKNISSSNEAVFLSSYAII